MKVSTNKSKKKAEGSDKPAMKVDTSTPTITDMSQPASFSVRQIKNGFLVDKSWRDKKGNYQSETEYRSENPLELEVSKK